MELQPVPSTFIDLAWREGAINLTLACDQSGNEITGDQLKLILSRGERQLFRMVNDGNVVGWAVARVDQLPNVRVLFVTDLYAPNGHFQEFWGEVVKLASNLGCSSVRCAAKAAQARLYKMKLGFSSVYEILEVKI